MLHNLVKHWRLMSLVATVILTTQLIACDAALDCLDSDGPQFDNDTIEFATLNQVYTGRIRASINNEPQDDRFTYSFKFTGQLPPGVETTAQGRDFIITGTPTELGTFTFRLFVEIEDRVGVDESGLCFTSHSQDFQLTVQQEN